MDHETSLAIGLRELRDRRRDAEPCYDTLVGRLRSGEIGSRSPSKGQRFEDFGLRNHHGQLRLLRELLVPGPIVLCFVRGRWCPYCRAELAAWKRSQKRLAEVNGRLVIVTPETERHAGALAEMIGENVEILLDAHHGLALAAGLAFWCGDDLQNRYRSNGLDFDDIYGSASGLLTVPATFVVDRNATTQYRFADPDFRLRAEPSDVISALRDFG